MRRVLAAAILIAILAGSVSAEEAIGSAFGVQWTGKTCGHRLGDFQAGIAMTDRTGVFGMIGYGLSEHSEGRLKLAFANQEGESVKLVFGADYKYQMMDVGAGLNDPFDLALAAYMEVGDYGPFSVWQLGGRAIGSHPFDVGGSSTLSPYGAFSVRLENINWDGRFNNDSDTELQFGIALGTQWRPNDSFSMYGELHFDGNEGLIVGLSLGVF